MASHSKKMGVESNPLSVQHGAPSFWLQSDKVELFLAAEGGHMAPVRFKLKHRWVSPYSLAPWLPDEIDEEAPPVLKILRGDFFCLPFGHSKAVDCLHGETANKTWQLVNRTVRRISLKLEMKQPEGQVTKNLSLKAGQRAVYQEHVVEGLQGRYSYGHHAIIEFPEDEKCFVNTSAIKLGQVKPEPFTDPAIGEYSSLKTGAVFKDLGKVPLATGGDTSLQKFPAREGFEDLVMIVNKPTPIAWTAVTLDGYIWFSLKEVETLPSTLFWISHGGRHQAPWNGRHRRRMGLEEVNCYFGEGLEASRKNPLSAKGISTTGKFSRKQPTVIRLVQGVHPVAKSFGMVESIEPVPDADEVIVTGSKGGRITVPVDWRYLQGAELNS